MYAPEKLNVSWPRQATLVATISICFNNVGHWKRNENKN